MVDKKGTMWLLQRLKAGEVLTEEVAAELFAYISQLEVSQDDSRCYLTNQLFNAIEMLMDRKTAGEIKNSIIVKSNEKKEDLPKFEFSDRLVHRDVRYSEELDSALADLAHHNKTATNEVIVRLLEQAVKMPGFYGLKS